MPTPLSIKYLAAYDDLEKADAGGISLASPAHRQRVLDKMSRLKKVPSLAAIADPAGPSARGRKTKASRAHRSALGASHPSASPAAVLAPPQISGNAEKQLPDDWHACRIAWETHS